MHPNPPPLPPQKKDAVIVMETGSLVCVELLLFSSSLKKSIGQIPGGVPPYKGLMGTCGKPGYVFRDFCLKQSIESIIFVLIRVSIYKFLS